MDAWAITLIASILLVVVNGFFVAAEYALIACRRSRIESLARRGNRLAKLAAEALKNLKTYVAGIQLGITMCGIGVGSVAEPFVTGVLAGLFGNAVDRRVGFVAALVIVTFFMVVIGELIPKYLTLRSADRVALAAIMPLRVFVVALFPLIWLVDHTGALLLRLFGIKMSLQQSEVLPKEELLLLIKAHSSEGVLEQVHAEMITRALKLDKLDARDIMIHRMDIQWIDVETPKAELFKALGTIPHSRIPVCRGDIDEVVGIAYLHDVVRLSNVPEASLESLVRPAVAVPENLSLDKIVERMREARSQMILVSDEYGGTAGLITLEDVVEEIFGDLEDRLETDRATIERQPGGRLSVRGDVRFDELVAHIGIDLETEPSTDTLANLVVLQLERVPRVGDAVDTPVGTARVENMARHRITRVAIQLDPDARKSLEEKA